VLVTYEYQNILRSELLKVVKNTSIQGKGRPGFRKFQFTDARDYELKGNKSRGDRILL